MTASTASKTTALDDCWNRIGVWSQESASCPELEHFIHCRNCDRYSAAGRQVLERKTPEDYRQEWTRRFSQSQQPPMLLNNSALLFRLGDEWLAINTHCVNEITQVRTLHSLPHRDSDQLKGLVNVRGELKICVSLGSVLQLEKAQANHNSDHEILERMIYVSSGDASFVFPVSEAHGTHRYADDEIQLPPATVANAKNNFISGIVFWKQQHVGILDHELLFYVLGKNLR